VILDWHRLPFALCEVGAHLLLHQGVPCGVDLGNGKVFSDHGIERTNVSISAPLSHFNAGLKRGKEPP